MTTQQAAPVTALLILDGWGYREDTAHNAPALANTPNFDALWAAGPRSLLQASGADVGLPEGQIGNSEVGHLNIGAGRVVKQTLPRIDAALADGSFKAMPAFQQTVAKTRAGSGRIHLLGLMSAGGVHSHQHHLAIMADAFADAGLEVLLHLFTDGRDTAPAIGAQCFDTLQNQMHKPLNVASISGRYYVMDRDTRWERTALALTAIRDGAGPRLTAGPEAVRAYLQDQEKDEFVEPRVCGDFAGMAAGDGLACINFRADRVRQVLAALLLPETPEYAPLSLSAAMAMAPYSKGLDANMDVLFTKDNIADTLAETVSKAGKTQFHCAETEKYPHVTFFFNGGREEPWPGETRHVEPSPKVATYDLQPEMSAPNLADNLVAAVESGAHDLIICNFANPDMVGHTGDLEAAIAACEAVDHALGRFLDALSKVAGRALITADHGNCERMWDEQAQVAHTAHTLAPVPLVLAGGGAPALRDGRLADLAPTLLALMGVAQPAAMTGQSLLLTEAEFSK